MKTAQPVLEMEMLEKPTEAIAPVAPTAISHTERFVAPRTPKPIIEQLIQLAKDPGVDVGKIDKLIDANQRVMADQAKAAFNRGFAKMQGKLPVIGKRGMITVSAKEGRAARETAFATLADIQRAVRPVLQEFGFGLRFEHEFKDNLLTVTGILSHEDGHSVEDRFVTSRDDSGNKNIIQSWGSARSYGQRYVTISLLNLATDAEDDDGEASEARAQRQAPPDGYDNWLADLEITADDGEAALRAAWKNSPNAFALYLTETNRPLWDRIKAKAKAVR